MYSIKKDKHRDNKIIIRYFLPNDRTHHVYEIENAERLLGQFIKDHHDLGWMDDLIRLSDKTIHMEDNGEWKPV